MSYKAENPEQYLGQVVGSGECVAYPQAAAGAPNTGNWTAGIKVHDAQPGTIERGTVIATMVNGLYPNKPKGNHAAIYLSQDATGIQVIDQWRGQPVHNRTIRWRGGQGNPSDDGDAFYVVE